MLGPMQVIEIGPKVEQKISILPSFGLSSLGSTLQDITPLILLKPLNISTYIKINNISITICNSDSGNSDVIYPIICNILKINNFVGPTDSTFTQYPNSSLSFILNNVNNVNYWDISDEINTLINTNKFELIYSILLTKYNSNIVIPLDYIFGSIINDVNEVSDIIVVGFYNANMNNTTTGVNYIVTFEE